MPDKRIVNDPIDIVIVAVDTGGPHTTTSPTPETVAVLSAESFPPGTYKIDVIGQLSNTSNNTNGLFQLVINGQVVPSSVTYYESGTAGVPKEFLARGYYYIASASESVVIELQAATSAGTLSVDDIVYDAFMVAKRDVAVAVDLTPPP